MHALVNLMISDRDYAAAFMEVRAIGIFFDFNPRTNKLVTLRRFRARHSVAQDSSGDCLLFYSCLIGGAVMVKNVLYTGLLSALVVLRWLAFALGLDTDLELNQLLLMAIARVLP